MTRARKPLRINYLSQGMESPAKIDILLSVTKIKRPELIAGLKDYYCRGYSKVDAAAINGVASQNMSSPIAKLDQVAEAFEKYIELKANELTSSKLTLKQQSQAKNNENFNKEYLS
tara:strand:- start:41592 stop:41939 length:348 start_codon:yes stop_codon:yes gene_type:complete